MATTLQDIRERVLDDLKRSDATRKVGTAGELDFTRLDRWIFDAVRRIQRSLRTPIDEVTSRAIIPEGFAGSITIPATLVEPISIRADGHELEMRGASDIAAYQKRANSPALYYDRVGSTYRIAPLPPPGTEVEILYRAEFSRPVNETDSLKLFDVAADLVVQATLISAASWAVDGERMAVWNQTYNTLFLELQDLFDRTELLNAKVTPLYNFRRRR